MIDIGIIQNLNILLSTLLYPLLIITKTYYFQDFFHDTWFT